MADCMSFPDTMDEFLEQYSFKDTDEVYTNGSELIQVFRVKQGLEHYEAETRAKAIEEFAEKLKIHVTLDGSCNMLNWSSLSIVSMIGDIASELKGE